MLLSSSCVTICMEKLLLKCALLLKCVIKLVAVSNGNDRDFQTSRNLIL